MTHRAQARASMFDHMPAMKRMTYLLTLLLLTLYVIFTGTAHAACIQSYVTIPTDPNRFNNAWNVATKKVMTDHEHRGRHAATWPDRQRHRAGHHRQDRHRRWHRLHH